MPEETDYKLEDIVDGGDFGPDPSAGYLQRVELLDSVIRTCTQTSRKYGGIPAPSTRHYYASVLFTTLVTRGVSLLNLAPHSPWAQKMIEHWDYASAAVITRTILEIRLCFYYLCVDSVSEDEWNCRWNILNLHDNTARYRLFEAQGKIDEAEKLRQQGEELKLRLESNPYFQTFPSGQKRKILNGQTAYLLPLEQIATSAGIEVRTFRWLYIFLSSHVHGLPMSFYRIGEGPEERGRGLPSDAEEGYTSLCLSFSASLLASARSELIGLFADLDIPDEVHSKKSVEPSSTPLDVDKFPIGSELELHKTDDLRIVAARTEIDEVEIYYFYGNSNNIVLKQKESEINGDSLLYIDPAFWTITVDDKPCTEAMLSGAAKSEFAFKIDPYERTIGIKTRKSRS